MSKRTRNIYKAIMVAAAKGRGLRLKAEEVFNLSMDDAIMTSASNALTEEEIRVKDGGGYHDWEKMSPYPQGEPAEIFTDRYPPLKRRP